MMTKQVFLNSDLSVGGGNFIIIAGPCVIEDKGLVFETAAELLSLCKQFSFNLVFKSSFDKANRSSISTYRGPGIEKGLRTLAEVREKFSVPITTDVHSVEQVNLASGVVDLIQIPAFLCRQTDLVVAAAKTGKPVNVKKGQFMAPWDIKNVIDKVISAGNHSLLITERGTSFGYNNLVVDFRSIPIMREYGYPIIFDATHSVQKPGGLGDKSGGERQFAYHLARAAVVVGVDGVFLEVHPDPDKALSDGPNMLPLSQVADFFKSIKGLIGK